MGKLEQPIVRWTIACLFLAVELLWFVVIPDPGEGDLGSRYVITPADQVMWTVLSFVLFFVLLSALKDFGERDRPLACATEQVETTQQRRARYIHKTVVRCRLFDSSGDWGGNRKRFRTASSTHLHDKHICTVGSLCSPSCPWLLYSEAASDDSTVDCGHHSHCGNLPEPGGGSPTTNDLN